jgi:hypothetical protein
VDINGSRYRWLGLACPQGVRSHPGLLMIELPSLQRRLRMAVGDVRLISAW